MTPKPLAEETPRIKADDLQQGHCIVQVDGRLLSINVDTVQVPQPFGGARTYALCPSCSRRCVYLYIVRGSAMCRHCGGLAYRSQRLEESARLGWRAYKLRQKLARDRATNGLTPLKPLGMHWTTYDRISARIDDLEHRCHQAMIERWPELADDAP